MANIEVDVMKGVTNIKGRSYTMYSGYMTPNNLIKYCNVPSFARTETHVSIANGLRQAPISNWQRPVKVQRLKDLAEEIDGALPNSNSNDSLMANPVLIGRSDELNGTSVNIEVKQKSLNVNGIHHPIPELFEVSLSAAGQQKPLWILDGQHRIHGLGDSPFVLDDQGNQIPNGSIVADEVIPVVFIIDDSYKPKFLAKIFTQVTTEAKTMEPLHGDWMQFAFQLGDYANNEEGRLAFYASIELASIQDIDNTPNPFYDKVKFNPHKELVNPVSPFKSISSLWLRKLLQRTFYEDYTGPGKNWPNAEELANCIVRFYRAAMECDSNSGSDSRLFGPNKGLETLTVPLFEHFFRFISTPYGRTLIRQTKQDWVNFLKHSDRLFHASDWSLPNVTKGSVQKNEARGASKRAVDLTFKNLFFQPTEFNGIDPALWMQGPGEIAIESCQLGPQFKINKSVREVKFAGGGNDTINLRSLGHKMIRFKSLEASQASITKVEVYNHQRSMFENQENKKSSITLTSGSNKTDKIRITTICYSDDSKKITTFNILS